MNYMFTDYYTMVNNNNIRKNDFYLFCKRNISNTKMTLFDRQQSTYLQKLRIDVYTIDIKNENDEKTFANNLYLFLQLIYKLQNNHTDKEEAKANYIDMLSYCLENKEYILKKFNTLSIYLSDKIELKTIHKWFIYVNKTQDMEEIEKNLIDLEII